MTPASVEMLRLMLNWVLAQQLLAEQLLAQQLGFSSTLFGFVAAVLSVVSTLVDLYGLLVVAAIFVAFLNYRSKSFVNREFPDCQ
jgi:hypothetical protein